MIIFDCDGVLVDSEILSCETDAQLMSEAGYPITTEELIHEFIGRPKPAIWAELEKRRGTPWPDGLLDRASVCGLSGFFGDHVYSAELVARGKPAPDVFLLAACKVGTDPADCLVIEDSAAGITAARRAGMRAIGFTGGRHSWPAHRSVLEEAGAIDILTHMRDLPDTIEKNLRAT